MDKITDKIAALPADGQYFSLEFFPPKTAMGFSNLCARLQRMQRALRPLFINVTWGAGGSTAEKSMELARFCQREVGLTTCLHLTCTNMSRDLIDSALEEARALGIRNILALRGDPPRNDEYGDVNGGDAAGGGNGGGVDGDEDEAVEFSWAVDLVRYIRRKYGDYFCIGVSAYPEGHASGSHPEEQSLEYDLPYLVDKVQAGADFIMTQLFFDISAYDRFETTLRAHPSGAFKTIPIIAGLMPIQSYAMIKRTTKLSHARMPEGLMARLDAAKGDDEKVKLVGVDILSQLVEQVRHVKSRTPGPRGFHFYTLNLEKAVSFILERTKLIPDYAPETGTPDAAAAAAAAAVAVSDNAISAAPPRPQVNGFGSTAAPRRSSHSRTGRRLSSVGSDPHNRVIVAGRDATYPEWEATTKEAGVPAESINTRLNTLAISEGEGTLGREATWDDFPNGRFGDARSPAYGEIDGYGVSIHMSVPQAVSLWGRPTTPAHISDIFTRHIRGELSAIPWSEEDLVAESSIIQSKLVAINARGWWTVASQPAVNGAPSSHPAVGWGPPAGFCFQKAFVEFFIPSADWAALLPRLTAPGVRDSVCFFAGNARGGFASSDDGCHGPGEDGRPSAAAATAAGATPSTNAVTWGVFPGKEIVTPTIIEEVSFRAWNEEAFDIWGEWARVYPRRSESHKFLNGIKDDYWLVNVIHHDFPQQDALWDLLLE
ncbi:Methylenetetrahydrofolate reductase 2 [Escovopsis weberi]|uniref:Methylenetetrahydrofolate reductase 2 n=1 Tax=Escovopsis weberi TaxID=150374 RepID=A0A0M8MUP3_ESCWE|nr:Methylenetetrahydrofolate reductase 2 [Escovopsis weberi]